jgi:hypothetical protein
MAGSVSAGAYTAGVVDYLMEALENWEAAREGDPSLPTHKVEIDLLGGSSGGGITAAMAFFAFRDQVEHGRLEADGKTYKKDLDNIFWNCWVELTGEDVFAQLLELEDVKDFYIPAALNSDFIDQVAQKFERYVEDLAAREAASVPRTTFLSEAVELFMTLFNVTGMKYELSSKALSATKQYVSEHRDLAHFRWDNNYHRDGRMEITFQNLQNLPTLLQASMATGAFPVGLRARIVERPAKYIWHNPFFRKNNKFNKDTINLGPEVLGEEDLYRSLNADGGTSNNEPVELMRDLMLQIRLSEQNKLKELQEFAAMSETERMVAKTMLTNYSIILIDPFPSYDFPIKEPEPTSDHLFRYAPKLVFAMNSQLQFDAKEAIDAYNKDNYGLHVIAPSRRSAPKPEYAIACGALGGFGGFLSREYRVHDFFLGRHNCQSFLRKYFVVNPDEPKPAPGKPNDNYQCVQAVLEGYQDQRALERYCFTDENEKRWVPIIPDVLLKEPIRVRKIQVDESTRIVEWDEPGKLPLYRMNLPQNDFLEAYREKIERRANRLLNNAYDSNWFGDLIRKIVAARLDDRVAGKVIDIIKEELVKRELIQR